MAEERKEEAMPSKVSDNPHLGDDWGRWTFFVTRLLKEMFRLHRY